MEKYDKLLEENQKLQGLYEREREQRERLERENAELLQKLEHMGENLKQMEMENKERFASIESQVARMALLEERMNVTGFPNEQEEGAVGGSKTARETEKNVHSTPKEENADYGNVKVKESRKPSKKQISRKQRKAMRKERKKKLCVSADDSLYSEEEQGKECRNEYTSYEEESDSESESSSVEVHKGILIREVPRIEKFNVYSSRNVNEFFEEFENYCRHKYPDHPGYWVKELGECMEGRILEFYRNITSVCPVKYDIVKERICDQVARIRGSIRFKRKDDFEKVRMLKNENLDSYAHRLETLARKKYGNEGIDESKTLVRKFLDTVPEQVAEWFHLKRKEKMRLGSERLKWGEILEMLEDRPFDEEGKYYPKIKDKLEVQMGRSFSTGGYDKRSEREGKQTGNTRLNADMPVYKSYRDAVMDNSLEDVVARVVRQCLGEMNVRIGGRDFGASDNRTENGRSNQERGVEGPAAFFGNGIGLSSPRLNENERNWNEWQQVGCSYCKRPGHTIAACRKRMKVCFGCGGAGHFVYECMNPKSRCFECGQLGHVRMFCPTLMNGGNPGVRQLAPGISASYPVAHPPGQQVIQSVPQHPQVSQPMPQRLPASQQEERDRQLGTGSGNI